MILGFGREVARAVIFGRVSGEKLSGLRNRFRKARIPVSLLKAGSSLKIVVEKSFSGWKTKRGHEHERNDIDERDDIVAGGTRRLGLTIIDLRKL